MPVHFTSKSELELVEIWKYICRESSIDAADRIWNRFEEVFQMLGRQPLIGEACEEYGTDLRCFPVGKYVIYYQPVDDGVLIVHIVHGARDIPAFFSDN